MTLEEVIDLINEYIVENHNQEITGDILNGVLLAMLQQPNELIGDLSDLTTGDNANIVEAINWIVSNLNNGSQVHVGEDNPNVTPPADFAIGDFYSQIDEFLNPVALYVYTGTSWVNLAGYITKESEQWLNFILSGTGGLPTLVAINENQRNINITGNPSGDSSLGGYHNGGGSIPTSIFWDGMTVKVLNSSPNNQTIKHNYSGADIKYLFPNEEDYTIRPNEVVYFDLKGGNLIFRYSTFLNAKNVFFDNTGSILSANDTEDAIKEIAERSLLKLESNLTFTVGAGKDFETISEAIDQALNYYPNEDYKITILIDEGFEIEESFHYWGLDFSHIIFSTTGEIILTSTPAAIDTVNPLFYFNSCWLPSFKDFKLIKSDSLTTAHIVGLRTSSCTSGYLSNTDWLKFTTCLWLEQTSNFYIENTNIKPFRRNTLRRGLRVQNSIIDVRSINIDTYPEDSYYDNENNVAIECISSSMVNMRQQGGTTSIKGSFKLATKVGDGSNFTLTSLTELNIDGDYDILIRGGNFYNQITTSIGNDITANIPYNTITELGLALKSTKPVPYKFNGTDYLLYYIKAPSGQEYNVTVDDTGKLKSEVKPDLSNFLVADDLGSAAFEDSDVEPTTGTIPLRYGLGEGRVKVGNGISEKDAVNKSQLDAQAVGRVRVHNYKVSLNKSQINNLDTTPISVLWSDMGLTDTQSVRWRPELTAVNIDDDATPFSGSSPIHIGKYPFQGVISVPATTYGVNGVYAGFPVQQHFRVEVEPEFTIETASVITGGGASGRIEIMLFFEIDTISF